MSVSALTHLQGNPILYRALKCLATVITYGKRQFIGNVTFLYIPNNHFFLISATLW